MGAYTFADPVSGAPAFTGKIFRSLLSVFAGGKTGTRPVGGRSGVAAGIPSTIVTVAMPTYTVTPFCGYLDTSAGSTDGGTPFEFDTNQTGTVTVAHATLERIDLLFVRLDDPAEGDGTSTPQPVVGYTAGTAAAAGSQVAPATPGRAFALARINVPHSGSGSPTVTWVAPTVVAAGGITPAASSAAYPASPYVGQYVDDATIGLLRWNGSVWISTAPSLVTATGTLLSGSYDSTKPVRTYYRRVNSTTDVNALAAVTLTSTCVLAASVVFEASTTAVYSFKIRYDLTNSSTIAFQMHQPSGTAAASTAYVATFRIDYQT